MTSRREFLQSATAAVVLSPALQACSSNDDGRYADAVEETWQHSNPAARSAAAQQRELVRYATLAPSSHNSQCWKFKLGDGRISILPDRERRCPAVDPDDHHLYVSLGCAAENLVLAAEALGLHGEVGFDPAADAVDVLLTPAAAAVRSALFEAIPQRQSTRGAYDGRAVAAAELKSLEQAGTGRGVRVVLLTERAQVEQIIEYITRANTAQLADRAFVAELKRWIRFNAREAVTTRDGLFTGSTGNPSLPRWIGSALMSWFITPASESQKYALQVRSSAGVAVFISEADNEAHWIEVGRCYQRFALQATALGIRNAMVNQPVEVAAVRPHFGALMGAGAGRPDLIVRFGYGPEMPRSLRRPVELVLV